MRSLMRLFSFKFFLVGLCFTILLGCVQSPRLNHGLIGRLRDRGPVALSSDNPFLAANLLLTKEMERSPDLTGFIKHRGAPAALAVEHSSFSGLNLKLYYPENREYFNLEEIEDTWLINGPLPIPRNDMPEVARITRNQSQEPKLILPDSLQAPIEKTSDQGLDVKDGSAFSSFTSTTVKPQLHGSPDSRRSDVSVELERMVTRTAKSPAELTPRGDLVHFVTYAGETLALLARWYTYDADNGAKIARINRLAKPDELKLGDQIVIPAYLLRNKQRLTEPGLKALQEFVWGQKSARQIPDQPKW